MTRAQGGILQPGEAYVVGEKGPEGFWLPRGGITWPQAIETAEVALLDMEARRLAADAVPDEDES